MAVRAPDFRPELEWVNTGGRHLLRDFRGKILLLDFWAYGCINCIHMIPELREIEARFPDEVAVVGVHSGKFINERVTQNIARACERLGVDHPVLNDRQFRTWREYAIRAWPTLVIVSPTGYVLASRAGEVRATELSQTLERVLAEARAAGTLSSGTAVPRAPTHLPPPPGPLRFPAKIAAAPGRRLFVSDTGNHRVLEMALGADSRSARVTRVFGSGEPGWRDGPPSEAMFRSPHGLALAGEVLYVADTENHLVRAVTLSSGVVRTVAGTGEQARPRSADGPARHVALNSPWDLLWHRDRLYVAMAGNHQLWRVDPAAGRAEVFAGSGAEELHDAPLTQAALAQPSGLATDGERIYFADAEASAIRWATPGEDTGTVVGTGLFDFGDRNGVGDEVRLQHALGVAWWEAHAELLITDTYNHRIKRIDPATRRAEAFSGSGEPGMADGPADEARFWEPGGIAIPPEGAYAYVADTNNHALRAVELDSGRVETVAVEE